MSPVMANRTRFSALFEPSHVICHTELTERDAVIMELLRRLAYERGIGNVEAIFRHIVEREGQRATVLAPGITMPHARIETVERLVVGIATSAKGIAYPQAQEGPVKLLILTLAPKDAPGAYLQALAALAKVCQDPGTAEAVARLESAEEVWQFFDRGGMMLPEHLSARDLMEPVRAKLFEHDTLERAIDLFVRQGLRELPVVDKNEDLMGVVTTYELLRVCLPDYILWMDDLTPILNFEPFAEILRRESKTWLPEIMTADYATVAEDAPAVQVAKEITRQHADCGYVLRGKKLVGVVSLVGLLDKIMRE